jgi:hypothetical protein
MSYGLRIQNGLLDLCFRQYLSLVGRNFNNSQSGACRSGTGTISRVVLALAAQLQHVHEQALNLRTRFLNLITK